MLFFSSAAAALSRHTHAHNHTTLLHPPVSSRGSSSSCCCCRSWIVREYIIPRILSNSHRASTSELDDIGIDIEPTTRESRHLSLNNTLINTLVDHGYDLQMVSNTNERHGRCVGTDLDQEDRLQRRDLDQGHRCWHQGPSDPLHRTTRFEYQYQYSIVDVDAYAHVYLSLCVCGIRVYYSQRSRIRSPSGVARTAA